MKYTLIIAAFILLLLQSACKKYEDQDGAFKDDFVLSLPDSTGVKADGRTSITLRLSNTLHVKEGLRVVFTSGKGTVLQPDQTYTTNSAETKLLLAEDTGTFLITAQVKEGSNILVEKSVAVKFRPAYELQDFAFRVFDTTGVRADGVSTIGVRFASTLSFLKPGLILHMDTDRGTYLQNDISFINPLAETRLTVSQDSGAYFMKAQLKDGNTVKIEKTIFFALRRAHPQTIQLELNRSTWNPSQPITIKTLLKRAIGKVTTGEPVFFEAYQLDAGGTKIPVGRFEGLLGNTSQATGALVDIKHYMDTPGVDITRPLHIQAKTITDLGDTLRNTVTIPYL